MTKVTIVVFPPGLWQILKLWDYPCMVLSQTLKGKNVLLAFVSSATRVCRFICSYPVLPAGNCWLVAQFLLGDLVWLEAQVHPQPCMWSGHQQLPCLTVARLSKWRELSFHLLCWGKCPQDSGSFPVTCKHLWCLCTRKEPAEVWIHLTPVHQR